MKDQPEAIKIIEVDKLSEPDTEWRFEGDKSILNDFATGTSTMRFFYVHIRDLMLSQESETTSILIEILSNDEAKDRVKTCQQIMEIYIERGLNKSEIIRECIDHIKDRDLTYPSITGTFILTIK
jgi:DNA polymerase elongation subunit (family B)